MSGGRCHFLPLGFSDDICRSESTYFTMDSSCCTACSWSLKVSVSTQLAVLTECDLEHNKASALLLFEQPLRYFMVKSYAAPSSEMIAIVKGSGLLITGKVFQGGSNKIAFLIAAAKHSF